MAEKKDGMSVPIRQDDVWSVVRITAVVARTWQGEEIKKNGLTVYRVSAFGILMPEEKTFGKGGEFFDVSVPMTEEDFTKLSDEPADTVVRFSGLKAHFYGQKSYTASGVQVVRANNQNPIAKP